MKRWQVIVVIVMLAAAVWAVLLFPPSSRTVQSVATPTPTPRPAADAPVTLLFAGDVMLSRAVGGLLEAKDDWLWPFRRVASTTAEADLMFANLETVVSTRGTRGGCGFCFRSDPRVIQGLVYAGFDVMSVANNHIWDYGIQAFLDTLGALATADISPVGGGRNSAEARAGVVREVRGTRIAYLAYTDLLPAGAGATTDRAGVNLYDEERMKEDIATARAQADIVVVSFHAGTEYESTHNASQERIYTAAIDAGADLVVGTHPHVVQEVVQYGSGWIAYSLGNFVFDQGFSEATMTGLMLSVRIEDGRIVAVKRIPISISRQYQPVPNSAQ